METIINVSTNFRKRYLINCTVLILKKKIICFVRYWCQRKNVQMMAV